MQRGNNSVHPTVAADRAIADAISSSSPSLTPTSQWLRLCHVVTPIIVEPKVALPRRPGRLDKSPAARGGNAPRSDWDRSAFKNPNLEDRHYHCF